MKPKKLWAIVSNHGDIYTHVGNGNEWQCAIFPTCTEAKHYVRRNSWAQVGTRIVRIEVREITTITNKRGQQ